MGLKEMIGETLQRVKDSYHTLIPGDISNEFEQFKEEVYKGECLAISLRGFNEAKPDLTDLQYYGYIGGMETGRFRFIWFKDKLEKSFVVARDLKNNSFIVTEENLYDVIDLVHF